MPFVCHLKILFFKKCVKSCHFSLKHTKITLKHKKKLLSELSDFLWGGRWGFKIVKTYGFFAYILPFLAYYNVCFLLFVCHFVCLTKQKKVPTLTNESGVYHFTVFTTRQRIFVPFDFVPLDFPEATLFVLSHEV